jgi:SAM-dependent methyltransferase
MPGRGSGTHHHDRTAGPDRERISDGPVDRRAAWDERHRQAGPIESVDPHPLLVRAVGQLVPGRALDLATGDGTNATWLAQRGWNVTGVDYSSVGLDRARAHASALGLVVEWVLADLLVYRPPARAFDLVTILYLHLPEDDRRTVLRAAADAVAAGGTLVAVGHDRTNLADGVGGPQDPDVLFTPGEIAGDLAAIGGFRLDVVQAVRREGLGRVPIDALVIARRIG